MRQAAEGHRHTLQGRCYLVDSNCSSCEEEEQGIRVWQSWFASLFFMGCECTYHENVMFESLQDVYNNIYIFGVYCVFGVYCNQGYLMRVMTTFLTRSAPNNQWIQGCFLLSMGILMPITVYG